ncbi:MAG: class I SAM-dependent methyltransferase [Chloroflexi bacterium]|nr:class I SAM-dependent methyltransferase [Chloroflexota bacterium]
MRTAAARGRYNRIAPVYDIMESLMERRFKEWRKLLWSKVEGGNVLEIGVGTGKNFPYYPAGASITAVDFSEKMLTRAQEKAVRYRVKVSLREMDAQHLDFPDNTFDTVVATFVFCSVPDPVRGLIEAARVCRPGGKVVLLEHVLSANRFLAGLMDLANPVVVRMVGANINRRTVENVRNSGLVIEQVTDLASIVKLIEARKA